MRSLILASLILVGCGQQNYNSDPRSIRGVDPSFNNEIATYLAHKPSHKLDYDIPIQFGDLDGNTVGLCTRWSNGYRQIIIDRFYWEHEATSNERLSLISHELGHCDLNLDHSPVVTAIMYMYNTGNISDYAFAQLFGTTTTSKLEHHHTDGCVEDIEVQLPGNEF